MSLQYVLTYALLCTPVITLFIALIVTIVDEIRYSAWIKRHQFDFTPEQHAIAAEAMHTLTPEEMDMVSLDVELNHIWDQDTRTLEEMREDYESNVAGPYDNYDGGQYAE